MDKIITMTALAIGSIAPDFSAVDQKGNKINLSEIKDKYVVLYFYPKDSSPGCTIEAKKFRDKYNEIVAQNAIIIGVSTDNDSKHKSFTEDYTLPFSLISDTDFTISKKYNALSNLNLLIKKISYSTRKTFLIHKGKIVYIWDDVSVFKHADEVLEKLKELNQSK